MKLTIADAIPMPPSHGETLNFFPLLYYKERLHLILKKIIPHATLRLLLFVTVVQSPTQDKI